MSKEEHICLYKSCCKVVNLKLFTWQVVVKMFCPYSAIVIIVVFMDWLFSKDVFQEIKLLDQYQIRQFIRIHKLFLDKIIKSNIVTSWYKSIILLLLCSVKFYNSKNLIYFAYCHEALYHLCQFLLSLFSARDVFVHTLITIT